MYKIWLCIGTYRLPDGTLRRVAASPDCATRAAAEALAHMLRQSGVYIKVHVRCCARYGPQR